MSPYAIIRAIDGVFLKWKEAKIPCFIRLIAL